MRLLGSFIAAASVLFCSGTSLALFDVEAMVGKRWYQFENTDGDTKNVASQEINVSAHLDPIPLIPVGFGLGIISGNLNKGDFGPDVTEASVLEVDLEVKAWIPMVPVVTPYVKVKIPLSAKLAIKGKGDYDSTIPGDETYAAVYKLTGLHVNAGVQIPIIPLIKVTVEVGKGMQSWEVEEVKIASTKSDTTSLKKEKVNSDNVMVGILVGF